MTKETRDKVKTILKQLADHADIEDRASRERQLRTWRRLQLLWEGYSRTWYSETAHDWRIWDEEQGLDTDQAYYDEPMNLFRAYLESIIAALSVTVPSCICYPDDAEDELDLLTAKAGNDIAKQLARWNNYSLLWVHALFVYCLQGMVACYHKPEEDESYGQYEEKIFEDVDQTHQILNCPRCGYQLGDNVLDPDEDKPTVHKEDCPGCGETVKPKVTEQVIKDKQFKENSISNKQRVCMEAYGGLNVKIPNWARSQKDTPYLVFSYETHYANAIADYKDLKNDPDIQKIKSHGSAGAYDQYDQWARLSPQYQGEYPINVVTMKYYWFRPALFNVLKDDADIKYMEDKFPSGVTADFVNGICCDFEEECLDDVWTLTKNPLSNFMQDDPIAMLITSVQDIINDLVSLVKQTIEHGIGQAFADPSVLNFKKYQQAETLPGAIYPIKQGSLGGKAIGDAFYEMRTATLSAEVLPFLENIQTMGQTIIGALPSLWGGQIQGSKTASVYSMSKSQALQRLGNTWKMLLSWWEEINNKVIPMQINCTKEDERDVMQDKDGNFVNILIRKAELEGNIGKIQLEANENLPQSWNQIRDNIMQLLQNGNPQILEIMGASENLELIREAIGISDIYVPGEDDRSKQYEEIKQLLNSEPLSDSEPSVPIDPIYDNHMIEFEIVRKWVTSEAGREAKTMNPMGYKNVLLHGLQHQDQIKQSMMNNQPPPSQNKQSNVPPAKPNPLTSKPAPIMGDKDVATVQ